MDSMVLKKRNELFEMLKKEFENTEYCIRPRSEKKYANEEESTIVIAVPGLPSEKKVVCGVQVQKKSIPYKLWFDTHPEWETITKYPVKEWAKNGSGQGSGCGFYVETENECIKEIKNYLAQYY